MDRKYFAACLIPLLALPLAYLSGLPAMIGYFAALAIIFSWLRLDAKILLAHSFVGLVLLAAISGLGFSDSFHFSDYAYWPLAAGAFVMAINLFAERE